MLTVRSTDKAGNVGVAWISITVSNTTSYNALDDIANQLASISQAIMQLLGQ